MRGQSFSLMDDDYGYDDELAKKLKNEAEEFH